MLLKILHPPTDAYDGVVINLEALEPGPEQAGEGMEGRAYAAAQEAYDHVWSTRLCLMSNRRKKNGPANAEQSAKRKPWQAMRKAKVERAKKLANDPAYPPKQVTNAVANLLARHLDPTKDKERQT
jgi:hypothetical protein